MEHSNRPLVTVAVPAYNGEKFVESCLKNIGSQTYENIEVIVSDNCSSDETFSEIRKNIVSISGARCIRTTANMGAISNINYLLRHARGKFFVIWALDDNKPPNFIEECVKSFEVNPEAVLCIPRIEMSLVSTGKLIAIFQTKIPVELKAPCSRFQFALNKVPATAFYGLYNKQALNKLGWIPRKLAGDLAYLQGLSLLGDFVYSPNATSEFKIRDKWNTSVDDLKFFFGSEIPPISRFSFLSFYIESGKFVWDSGHSVAIKVKCYKLLVIHFVKTKLQRVFLKLLSVILTNKVGKKMAIDFYFKYLNFDHTEVRDAELFESRIILPVLRYW